MEFLYFLGFVVVWAILIHLTTKDKVNTSIFKPTNSSKVCVFTKWQPTTEEERTLVRDYLVTSDNYLEGRYLVNFKDSEAGLSGIPCGNDPLKATIVPYKGRLEVTWDNQSSAVIDHQFLNIFRIP